MRPAVSFRGVHGDHSVHNGVTSHDDNDDGDDRERNTTTKDKRKHHKKDKKHHKKEKKDATEREGGGGDDDHHTDKGKAHAGEMRERCVTPSLSARFLRGGCQSEPWSWLSAHSQA